MIGSSQAQYINYEDDNGWNLGFNLGGTWQEPKDQLVPYAGFSGGFTFGKSIYEKEGRFLAFDLRFRYLRGKSYGWKTTMDSLSIENQQLGIDTTIMGFDNYKLDLNEYTLEGVLTLNRLRERTGIILYGFGGVGLTDYRVKSDFINNGEVYDYSTVNTNQSDKQIADDLKDNFNDFDFETDTYGEGSQLKFMPSLGVGLGYQITEHFSAGLEHKITFPLHDRIDVETTGPNDRYHYTAFVMRWNLYSRYRETYTVDPEPTDPTVYTNPTPDPVTTTVVPTGNKPLVNIVNPAVNNHVTHNNTFVIKANIYYVENSSKVKFKQNGYQTTNFTFNPSTNQFVANVTLQPGNNIFEIVGTNDFGSDQDSKIVIYEPQQEILPPPIVTITNPATSPHSTESPNFLVTSTVLNIAAANQIEFRVNGVVNNNFNYNVNSKVFSANIPLQLGSNTIQIKATNPQGSDSKTAVIQYIRESMSPPVVTISNPPSSPHNTNSPVFNVNGKVHNVASKNQINVKFNGSNISNFTYDINTSKISFPVNLLQGTNIVQITGTNAAGTDSKSATIIYTQPEVIPAPIVNFVVPATTSHNVSIANMTIRATVLNVSGHSDITVKHNGNNVVNFSYNGFSKEVSFNVNLIDGANVFTVKGVNQAGSDEKTATVVYSKPNKDIPPVVTITSPNANPYATGSDNEVITATIDNVHHRSGVKATYNGIKVTNFNFDENSGKFSYSAQLSGGANVLTITGTNSAGNASKTQTIIYTPEACNPPEIIVKAPTDNPHNTKNSKGYIEADIINASTVGFKINGKNAPGYNYNASTGKFSSYINKLDEGATLFEIVAVNQCGTSSETITIIYEAEAPCDLPAINWVTPATTPYAYSSSNNSMPYAVNVLNVPSGKPDIQVKHNGNHIDFGYDSNTGMVNGNVILTEGPNTVEVIATNECGTTSKTVVINYKGIQPISPPEVLLNSPSSYPHSQSGASFNIKGKVKNVNAKKDVQVLLDGQNVTTFTYNKANSDVNISLNLGIGSHTLSVKGTNTAGEDIETVELIRTGQPPVVNYNNISHLTSATNPKIFSVQNIQLRGSVQNFNGATLTVTIDNTPTNTFTYNSSNGMFIVPVNFTTNNQTIKVSVTATNAAGSDTKTAYGRYVDVNTGVTTDPGNVTGGQIGGGTVGGGTIGGGNNSGNNGNNTGGNNGDNAGGNNGSHANEAAKTAQYNTNIKKADMYYNSKKWSSAKTYYQKALTYKPNDSYAKSRIAEVTNKMKSNVNIKPTGTITKPGGSKTNTGSKSSGSSSSGSKTTSGSKTSSGSKSSGSSSGNKAQDHNSTRSNRTSKDPKGSGTGTETQSKSTSGSGTSGAKPTKIQPKVGGTSKTTSGGK